MIYNRIKIEDKYNKLFDKMSWYAVITNINTDKVEHFNIFDSIRFRENLFLELKEEGKTRDEFVKAVRRACRDFWSRCEYEVIISPLINRGEYYVELNEKSFVIPKNWYCDENEDVRYTCTKPEEFGKNKLTAGKYRIQAMEYDKSEKIDVFYQLEPNMERLAEYIAKEAEYVFADELVQEQETKKTNNKK